jgi:hypothetical protein
LSNSATIFSLRSLFPFHGTHLASDVDAHTHDGPDGRIHTLGVTAGGEDGDTLALVRAMVYEPLLSGGGHPAKNCSIANHLFLSLAYFALDPIEHLIKLETATTLHYFLIIEFTAFFFFATHSLLILGTSDSRTVVMQDD